MAFIEMLVLCKDYRFTIRIACFQSLNSSDAPIFLTRMLSY